MQVVVTCSYAHGFTISFNVCVCSKTVWQRKVQVLSDQFLGTDVYMNIKMKENGYYYNSKNIKIT